MDYTMEWHIPKRVILIRVSGDVSLEELERFNNDILKHLNEGIAPVHLISIGENIRRVPTNLMKIRQTTTYLQHPNMGWTVIVQEKPNPLSGFMVSVATQASGMKLRQVKSLADALETLTRIDQTRQNPPMS
ncbi:MAG: hypothetical protein LCI00_26945 [Chloroflexi bacterium]|nr:hypothetical protein [Chloroflexota bacterium]MCC6893981.1 hypothetical protein [Anaerolineae bacterium]